MMISWCHPVDPREYWFILHVACSKSWKPDHDDQKWRTISLAHAWPEESEAEFLVIQWFPWCRVLVATPLPPQHIWSKNSYLKANGLESGEITELWLMQQAPKNLFDGATPLEWAVQIRNFSLTKGLLEQRCKGLRARSCYQLSILRDSRFFASRRQPCQPKARYCKKSLPYKKTFCILASL